MQWWMRPGYSRCWAMRKPGALGPEPVGLGDAHVLVDDLRMAAVLAELLVRVLHRRNVAQDVDAGRVRVDEEHRRALVRARVGVGDRHDDEEVGDRRVGAEPLAAADDVLVALLDRARLAAASGPTLRVRLGHAERRVQVAGEQRVQPALLLLLACPRGRGSRELPESGAWLPNANGASGEVPRISCMRPSLTWPKPCPPSSGSRCAAYRPRSLTRSRNGAIARSRLLVVEVERLERPDLLADELLHPVQVRLELGFRREVPHARVVQQACASSSPVPPETTGPASSAGCRATRDVEAITGIARRLPKLALAEGLVDVGRHRRRSTSTTSSPAPTRSCTSPGSSSPGATSRPRMR